MKKSVAASSGGLFTIVVKDCGKVIELYGPYRDAAEQDEHRRDWVDVGALDPRSEVALKLTVQGAVAIETFGPESGEHSPHDGGAQGPSAWDRPSPHSG